MSGLGRPRRLRHLAMVAAWVVFVTVSGVAVAAWFAAPAGAGILGAGGAPGVAVDPAYGPPLITIKVTGAHFCGQPCGPVAIALGSLYVASDIPVAADGTFTTFVRVPGTVRPGALPVVASQPQPNGAVNHAQTDFTVTVGTPAPTSYPSPSVVQPPTGGVPPAGTATTAGTTVPTTAIKPATTVALAAQVGTTVGTTTIPGRGATKAGRRPGPLASPADASHRHATGGTPLLLPALAGVAVVALAGAAGLRQARRRRRRS